MLQQSSRVHRRRIEIFSYLNFRLNRADRCFSGDVNPMREQHPWWGLVFERTCSRIRCRSSTDHRQFRQSRDATAPGTIRHFVFVLRKTLNQRSLCFHAPTQSLGGCIAWYGWANNLGLPLRLVSPTAGSPEVLVGMLDEDRRENAKGGLAGDNRR